VGETTSIGYSIQNQNNNAGDPQNSCNAADATPGTASTVNVAAVQTARPRRRRVRLLAGGGDAVG
jgi:hypothetical protein